MTEQLRVLGIRADRKLELARDLSAFMQKQVPFFKTQLTIRPRCCRAITAHRLVADFLTQAEIEQSYASELDKLYDKFAKATKRRLAKSANPQRIRSLTRLPGRDFSTRHRAATLTTLSSRRLRGGAAAGSDACRSQTGLALEAWGILLDGTRKKAATRAALSTQLLGEVKPRMEHMEQESAATARKCHDILTALQACRATANPMTDTRRRPSCRAPSAHPTRRARSTTASRSAVVLRRRC